MALSRRIENALKREINLDFKSDADIKDIFDKANFNKQRYSFNFEVDKLVDALVHKSKAFQSFVTNLTQAVSKARLNSDQTEHFFSKKIFIEIPEVKLFLDDIRDTVKANDDLGADYNTYAKKIDDAMIIDQTDQILAYIKGRYPEIDAREPQDHNQVRRLDSLARLLSLNPRLSVCTAVAVHNEKLFISLNASSPKVLSEIAYVISKRIEAINEFLNTIRTYDQSYFDMNEEQLVDELHSKLSQLGGFSLAKKIITQAIGKFTDAVIFDRSTFSSEISNVFNESLLNYSLLLPYLPIPNSVPAIMELNHHEITRDVLRDSAENGKGTYRFNEESAQLPLCISVRKAQRCASITDIHAEQMIAYYIFKHQETNDYNRENPLNIGVSKLCCKTCQTNLEQLAAIRTRGEHGVIYESTASLIDSEIAVSHPRTPTRGPTDAPQSPPKSAQKRRALEQPPGARQSKRPRMDTETLENNSPNGSHSLFSLKKKLPFDDASNHSNPPSPTKNKRGV